MPELGQAAGEAPEQVSSNGTDAPVHTDGVVSPLVEGTTRETFSFGVSDARPVVQDVLGATQEPQRIDLVGA